MSESNIDNNDVVQPAEIAGYVSIKTILEALYPAVLRRDITEQELVSRLENIKSLDKSQLTQLIRSFILSPEFAVIFEDLAAEQPLLDRNSIKQASKKLRSVAIVSVFNEVWLPFCLAIADYLLEEYSLQTLLVTYSPFMRAYDASSISPAVIQCVSMRDVLRLDDSFNPDLIVVHSFGFESESSILLERFPCSPLFVYGDAYKNSVSDIFHEKKPILHSLQFGFNADSSDLTSISTIPSKVLSSESVSKYRDILAAYYSFENADVSLEPARYAVFYLRYWGVGAYDSLEDEDVIECWIDTIRKNIPANVTLVIKNDPRVKPGMYEQFRGELNECRIVSMDFSEYLMQVGLSDESMGMLPVEYFYSHGFLCNATAHFVLDSSLAYSIAVDKNIRRPTTIFIGPDLESFSKFKCQSAIESITFGVELYSRGLLQSAEVGKVREIGSPSSWPRCFELT